MVKSIIYGMAKFCDTDYGYGSEDEKLGFEPNKLLKYLNNSKSISLLSSQSIMFVEKNAHILKSSIHYVV